MPDQEFSFMGAMQNIENIGVPGRDLPAYGQAKALQQAVARMQIENFRFSMMEKAAAMQLQLNQKKGMAALHSFLADKDFSDPATISGALGVAARFGLPEDATKPLFNRLQEAVTYRERMNLIREEYRERINLAREESQGRLAVSKAVQEEYSARETERISSREMLAEADRRAREQRAAEDRKIRLYVSRLNSLTRSATSQARLQEEIKKLNAEFDIDPSQLGVEQGTGGAAVPGGTADDPLNFRAINPQWNP